MSAELLKTCYLFRDLTAEELKVLQPALEQESFNRTDEVFSQEDPAMALYIIKAGSIRVQQKVSNGDQIEVATLGSGSHFGEMAFIDRERRSATITVMEKTEVLRVDYDKLQSILHHSPQIAVKFYRAMALFLCGRLRITTTDLSFAREMNLRHF